MDKIMIDGLEIFANHGVFPEENKLGQKFVISAVLWTDTRPAGCSDDLNQSINYGEVSQRITEFVRKNTFQLIETVVERLAEELVARLTIQLEASGRHVHLSRADVETLFGAGYRLNRTKDLSQPGQFACAERVTLEGPRGSLKNVVILGPERPESQVEISLTDAVALGLTPPVRLSGDTEGTPGLTLRHGDRVLRLSRGLIVAKRHIHMTPEDAARFGVADRQRVRLQCFTSRPLVFQDVEVRVSPQFSTVVHIDYDEANACGFQKGDRGVILK